MPLPSFAAAALAGETWRACVPEDAVLSGFTASDSAVVIAVHPAWDWSAADVRLIPAGSELSSGAFVLDARTGERQGRVLTPSAAWEVELVSGGSAVLAALTGVTVDHRRLVRFELPSGEQSALPPNLLSSVDSVEGWLGDAAVVKSGASYHHLVRFDGVDPPGWPTGYLPPGLPVLSPRGVVTMVYPPGEGMTLTWYDESLAQAARVQPPEGAVAWLVAAPADDYALVRTGSDELAFLGRDGSVRPVGRVPDGLRLVHSGINPPVTPGGDTLLLADQGDACAIVAVGAGGVRPVASVPRCEEIEEHSLSPDGSALYASYREYSALTRCLVRWDL